MTVHGHRSTKRSEETTENLRGHILGSRLLKTDSLSLQHGVERERVAMVHVGESMMDPGLGGVLLTAQQGLGLGALGVQTVRASWLQPSE